MLSRIIFCTAIALATTAVILLALLSPVSHKNSHSRPWLDLSLYIQKSHISNSDTHPPHREDAGALVFHRVLTEGPESTSRVVGKAQGFIIPIEQFAQSAFNVIYLTFETPEHSGSLSVQARDAGHNHKDREELTVVGGTGSFAFARGVAVFTHTDAESSQVAATYHLKLQLDFPNKSRKIPG